MRKLGDGGFAGKALEINSEKDIFDYLGMDFKKPDERNMWKFYFDVSVFFITRQKKHFLKKNFSSFTFEAYK